MASAAAAFWTGRRAAIGAALATTLGGAPPAIGRDAELVWLSARLVALERAVDSYPGDIGEDSPPDVLAMLNEHDATLQAMLHLRAETLAGFRAKAAAVDAMLPPRQAEDCPCDPRTLVRSLVDDLVGTGEGTIPKPAAPAGGGPPAAPRLA